MNEYMYLFVRRDLSQQQQIIQASHAAHLVGSKSPITDRVPNAVLISTHSEDDLLDIKEYLDKNQIKAEMFYEPDISQNTAIATYPLQGKERSPLRKFGLA